MPVRRACRGCDPRGCTAGPTCNPGALQCAPPPAAPAGGVWRRAAGLPGARRQDEREAAGARPAHGLAVNDSPLAGLPRGMCALSVLVPARCLGAEFYQPPALLRSSIHSCHRGWAPSLESSPACAARACGAASAWWHAATRLAGARLSTTSPTPSWPRCASGEAGGWPQACRSACGCRHACACICAHARAPAAPAHAQPPHRQPDPSVHRADGGDAAAEALETELLRVAALHAVQHVQGDLQAAVK